MQTNRSFLYFWAVALLAWLIFLNPYTAHLWHWIDLKFFYMLNRPLEHSSFLRKFWLLANHSIADWIEDGCILALYLVAIFRAPKAVRRRKTVEALFCILLIALTIIFFNRFIFRDILSLKRHSPSLALSDAVCLTDAIGIKSTSNKSFPGDHATTALLFGCSYLFLNRNKWGLIALGYALFLCLPRLAVGAHWLTDILIGSGSIVLLSMTLAFYTPLATWVINKWEKKRIPVS